MVFIADKCLDLTAAVRQHDVSSSCSSKKKPYEKVGAMGKRIYICKAFTLLELLVVVAIIGILVAIAVPNFMLAQVKAKASRVTAELRTLSIGLDAYRSDRDHFPPNRWHPTVIDLSVLSTPIAYISDVSFTDPFRPEQGRTGNAYKSYLYFYYNTAQYSDNWIDAIHRLNPSANYRQYAAEAYCLSSWGPDRKQDAVEWLYIFNRQSPTLLQKNLKLLYDPTNGVRSKGDIARFGGESGLPIVFP